MESLTIWEVFERSRKFFYEKPAVVFVRDTGKQVTNDYQRVLCEAEWLSGVLVNRLIAKGDRVCISMPNSSRLIGLYLALSRIGAVSVLLNPALPQERTEKIVKNTSSKLLASTDETSRLYLSSNWPETHPHRAHQESLRSEDTAAILYSSGTTGEQKGAELTVSNIYNNIKYTSALTGMMPDDRLICFLPLTHCFGLNFILGASLYTGSTLVLHEKFDLQQVLDLLNL